MAKEPPDLVIDASIAVKWFVPEEDSGDALRLRDAHVNGEVNLFAPALLLYEVANALRFRSDLTAADLKSDIEALFLLEMALMAPSSGAIATAASEARGLGVSVYDAVYLQLAQEIGATLVTADDELFKRAQDTRPVALLRDYRKPRL